VNVVPHLLTYIGSTLIWAIIGAAMGTLATAFLIGTAIYVRKRNRRKKSDKNSMEGADAFPDVEVSTKDTKPQASSYFGTIESREGDQDDVSTLGDPYFGEAVNAVMDRDDTVGKYYRTIMETWSSVSLTSS
jgi:hypothetical protein